MYEAILQVALSDGVVHNAEREFISSFAQQHDISEDEHQLALSKFGWTPAQWSAGAQEAQLLGGAHYIKHAIPELLKQAGVKSRLISAKDSADLSSESRGHPDEHPPR